MFTYRSVAQAALLNPPWLPSGGYLYTLDSYAYPLIGDLLVRDIGLPHVLAVLEPIWTKKTETASRLRGRLESILDWATTRGYRAGLNPARWKGHLDTVLPTAWRMRAITVRCL